MLREWSFPRRLKWEHVSYRLVLTRRIPERAQAAIYRSLPIFCQGKLVEDYLVFGPEWQLLASETSFEAALAALFVLQPSLRPRRKRLRRPPPAPGHDRPSLRTGA